MKRILNLALLSLFASFLIQSCGKDDIGPNDIRIKNATDKTFAEVYVENPDGKNDFGILEPGETSNYVRFDKAYNKADITLKIDDVLYSTESVNFSALTPLVTGKLTYELSIKDAQAHILEMKISEILPY